MLTNSRKGKKSEPIYCSYRKQQASLWTIKKTNSNKDTLPNQYGKRERGK
jgi:hypothetical protein